MEENNSNSVKFVVFMVAAVVLIVAGAVAWLVFGQDNDSTSKESTEASTASESESTESTEAAEVADSVEIVYTDNGFEKSSYTVKSGGEVTVKNDSSGDLQFSSGEHPTHHDNEELNMDVLAAGESTTFSPEKVGTWSVHDHFNDQNTTTLVVK